MFDTDYIVNHVKRGIREGRFAPGQRLVEADLVEELQAKRGHVREALRVLAGEGVVELIPQRGARVRKLTKADLMEMMPVLGGLLGVTIDLGIGKLSGPPFRARLQRHMREMRQQASSGNTLGFHHVSSNYHAVLAEAAGNRFLDYLSEKMHSDLFRNQFTGTIQITDWPAYLQHFEDMHNALLRGDSEAARHLIAEHQQRLLHGFYSRGTGRKDVSGA